MDHVYQLETECADAWPAVVDVPLGQWRLRAAGGFTGRANSALTIGDPGRPLSDALAEVRAFADRNDIAAAAHVVTGSPIESGLVAAGWTVNIRHAGGAESVVMTGQLGCSSPIPDGITVPEAPPDGWWSLAVSSAVPTPAQRRVLASGAPVGFGTARDTDGRVIGVVRGAMVGDLLHIARLAVDSAHRRRGLATGLLAAAANWAAERGATRCALQVATHNNAAIALYTRLGCRPHHGYRYWIPAA